MKFPFVSQSENRHRVEASAGYLTLPGDLRSGIALGVDTGAIYESHRTLKPLPVSGRGLGIGQKLLEMASPFLGNDDFPNEPEIASLRSQ